MRKPLSFVLAAVLGSTALLAQGPAPAGDIVGVGNFSHIVADLDVALEYYRDVLGLEPANSQPWSGNPAIMKMGNTPGAQSRMASLRAPNSEIGVELIEYKDIDRKPQSPRFQDPGAANFPIRFRDLMPVLARLEAFIAKHHRGAILTVGGKPTELGGNSRIVFVRDPDGFITELIQVAADAKGLPAGTGNVVGAGFEWTVADSPKTVEFYRLLGIELKNTREGDGWLDNPQMASTAGVPGAKFRQYRGSIPGTRSTITSIEFGPTQGTAFDRKPLTGRIQDPGTAILQLRVANAAALTKKLKDAGATVVSAGGVPAELAPGVAISIVRDPSNLYLELIQAPAR